MAGPGGNSDDKLDHNGVAFNPPVTVETAINKRQQITTTNSTDETLAAPSLPSPSRQPRSDGVPALLQNVPPIFALPRDLIVEILSRLPVKLLLQLRCVCKLWKSIISDPQFAKKQLRMSITDPKFTHHRLMFRFENRNLVLKSCSLKSIFYNQHSRAVKLKPFKKRKRNHYDAIVGSYNGLICFPNDQNHVVIWNPSIRTFNETPELENHLQRECYTSYGFGYDHVNNSYKVVAVYCSLHGRSRFGKYKTAVKVFTLGTHQWRIIEPFPEDIVPEDEWGKCVSGTLNWAAWSGPASSASWVIISLDLGNESYQEIMQPTYDDSNGVEFHRMLWVLRECLCIICQYETHSVAWLMKDFGVKESWTKLLTIPHFLDANPLAYAVPLCVTENGEVLLWSELENHCLVLYNSRDNMSNYPRIRGIDGWVEAHVYVESLISPLSSSI